MESEKKKPEEVTGLKAGFLSSAGEAEQAAVRTGNPEMKKGWRKFAARLRTIASRIKE